MQEMAAVSITVKNTLLDTCELHEVGRAEAD